MLFDCRNVTRDRTVTLLDERHEFAAILRRKLGHRPWIRAEDVRNDHVKASGSEPVSNFPNLWMIQTKDIVENYNARLGCSSVAFTHESAQSNNAGLEITGDITAQSINICDCALVLVLDGDGWPCLATRFGCHACGKWQAVYESAATRN